MNAIIIHMEEKKQEVIKMASTEIKDLNKTELITLIKIKMSDLKISDRELLRKIDEISDLKDRIKKKDEINRNFRSKKTYINLLQDNNDLTALNIQLRKDIVKKQESGCFECKTDKRLLKLTNLSVCIECVTNAESNYWKGN